MAEHMAKMKHQAIVGNIGHFDNEIDMAGLAKYAGHREDRGQAAGARVALPGDGRTPGHSIIVLSEGRLLNLGNATGHPSFVMSRVVLEPDDRPDRDPQEPGGDSYDGKPTVTTLPKHLDEKVARLHLDAVGAKLTTLTK